MHINNKVPQEPVKKSSIVDKAFSHESDVKSYCRSFDGQFTSASGSTMSTVDGRVYIDFLAGCGALNYGHNDEDMAAALMAYISRGGVVHGLDMHTDAKAEFIQTFVDTVLAPRQLPYKLQFAGPTGTNANEAAMKLARKITGRSDVIAFTNGFHGVSLGALAATGSRHHRMGTAIQLTNVSRAMYDGYLGDGVDTADILDRVLSDPSSGFDAPAAILLETVQGEGGLNVASGPWLRKIAAIARQHGALLIIDDVQAGCGRTGSFFSFDESGITPDIVTLSKSISGFGLPMSLVLIHPDHDRWTPAEHNGTFRGNNLAFVSGSVALRKFWRDGALKNAVSDKADRIQKALQSIADKHSIIKTKGRGIMQGLDVQSGALAAEICRRCFNNGLIIETSGPHDEVVKILAALTIPDDLLNSGLAILDEAVDAVLHDSSAIAQINTQGLQPMPEKSSASLPVQSGLAR